MIDVYLDVDGVILSFPHFLSLTSNRTEWLEHDGMAYKPSVVAGVNALAEKPGVQMHWLTTWGSRARTKLCPAIGLNGQDWPVVGDKEHLQHNDGAWWKLAAIQGHHRGDEVLWIDDDIDSDLDALNWLHEMPDARWMSPDCWTGLHDHHLRIAHAWTEETR